MDNMIYYGAAAATAWIAGAVISYGKFKKKGFDYPAWYAAFWPCVLMLWPIWKNTHK